MQPTDYLPIQSFDMDMWSAKSAPLDFDLFVHLPLNAKYVLFRRKGQVLDETRMTKLAEHNVTGFFIKRDDYSAFVKHVAMGLREILSLKSGDREKASKLAARSLLRSTLTTEDPLAMQAMMNNLYDITSTIIESVLEGSNLGTKRAFRQLAELAQTGSSGQRHPVNVASLAVLIAYGIGYTAERTLYYMAVASLIHDIGLSKLPSRVALHAHDPLSLNDEDRRLLYQHSQLGVDLLRSRGLKLPEPVITMILQHHEFANGKGYPLGLRGAQINELTQIMQIADELDDRIIEPVRGGVNLKIRLHHWFEKMAEDRKITPILLGRVRAVIL